MGTGDKYGVTAADLAAEGGNYELARILRLFARKDVDESTSEANTPGEWGLKSQVYDSKSNLNPDFEMWSWFLDPCSSPSPTTTARS